MIFSFFIADFCFYGWFLPVLLGVSTSHPAVPPSGAATSASESVHEPNSSAVGSEATISKTL